MRVSECRRVLAGSIPDDETLRELVDRLATDAACVSCVQPLSAGFHYLRDLYLTLRQREIAAQRDDLALHPAVRRACRAHARAMYAIYRRDHPNC